MAKTQKPINPFKVAGKMMKTSLSKTKQVLNKKKTANNSTNAAAGVVSRTGGVRTITNAKVTGSKQKGIEGLKAKKKSGEMSRAEANAKIKALKGKAQPAKQTSAGKSSVIYVGGDRSKLTNLQKMDSTTAMNTMKDEYRRRGIKSNPQALYSMKQIQKQFPDARFSDFKFNKETGDYSFKHTTSKPTYTKDKLGRIRTKLTNM